MKTTVLPNGITIGTDINEADDEVSDNAAEANGA